MGSYLGQYVQQQRERLGIGRGPLARQLGYKNLSKGSKRIMDLEQHGACTEEFWQKIEKALHLDEEEARRLAALDQQERRKWKAQHPVPVSGIRLGNKILSFGTGQTSQQPPGPDAPGVDDTIEVTVDGQKVAGKLEFKSDRGFTMIMVEPYPGLLMESGHIPCFSTPPYTWMKHGYLTEMGMRKARELLEVAYRKESKRRNPTYLQDAYGIDLPTLRAAYQEAYQATFGSIAPIGDVQVDSDRKRPVLIQSDFEAHLQEQLRLPLQQGFVTDDEFEKQAKLLRQRLKSGQIDNKVHQRERKALSQRHTNYRNGLQAAWMAFCDLCVNRWNMTKNDLETFQLAIVDEAVLKSLPDGPRP